MINNSNFHSMLLLFSTNTSRPPLLCTPTTPPTTSPYYYIRFNSLLLKNLMINKFYLIYNSFNVSNNHNY